MSNGVRRIFFDKATGNKIHMDGWVGSFVLPTVEQNIVSFSSLSERNRDTFDVLELEFGEYENDFREGQLVGVNLETREPIFEYPNPEEPSAPIITDKPLTTQISEIKKELASAQTVLDFLLMGGGF